MELAMVTAQVIVMTHAQHVTRHVSHVTYHTSHVTSIERKGGDDVKYRKQYNDHDERCQGVTMQGLGFGVWGLGFGVWGLGFT